MKRYPNIFTPEMDVYLIANYPNTGNQQLCDTLQVPMVNLVSRSKHFKLKKTSAAKSAIFGKIELTPERERFIRDNYQKLSNRQMADALGLKITIARSLMYSMGIKRIELQMVSDEAATFIIENYRTMGDVEIAEHLQRLFPRVKPWTKKHVCKKRRYLKLIRTSEEIAGIVAKHSVPGGRSYTILNNSSSIHLQDGHVASLIAWRDPELKKEVLKHPEIIQLKRQEILLNRAIKEAKHAT